jgi:paraquat-inducible protein B
MLNTMDAPRHLMSEDLLTKLRERKAQLDKELTQKVSKDYNDLMGKVHENIESLRQGSKDFYAQKAQQELDKWEQAIKSGNTITAVSHKMMAETYLALARTF